MRSSAEVLAEVLVNGVPVVEADFDPALLDPPSALAALAACSGMSLARRQFIPKRKLRTKRLALLALILVDIVQVDSEVV